MTREEAIHILNNLKPTNTKSSFDAYVVGKAITMAIKTLEQEPSGDAISRQAVIDACEQSINILEAVDRIMDLPSVKQEPKTGHWIMPVQDDGMSDPICYQVRCSECGFDLDPQTWHMELHQYGADKYCPNCGARMVEPQERSDKE